MNLYARVNTVFIKTNQKEKIDGQATGYRKISQNTKSEKLQITLMCKTHFKSPLFTGLAIYLFVIYTKINFWKLSTFMTSLFPVECKCWSSLVCYFLFMVLSGYILGIVMTVNLSCNGYGSRNNETKVFDYFQPF